jgi:hypothetical protein
MSDEAFPVQFVRIASKIEAGKQFLVAVINWPHKLGRRETCHASTVAVQWGGRRWWRGYYISAPTGIRDCQFGDARYFVLRFAVFLQQLFVSMSAPRSVSQRCGIDQLVTCPKRIVDLILICSGVIYASEYGLIPTPALALMLLIVHFVVDFIVFGVTLLRRIGENGYRHLVNRIFGWLANNVIFAIVFSLFAYGIIERGCNSSSSGRCDNFLHSSFPIVVGLWFLNCCLAYVFTAVFADRIEADPPAVVASHAD